MLAQFARVRPSLEDIVGMIEKDPGIERLAPDFTRPEPAPRCLRAPRRLSRAPASGRHRPRALSPRRHRRVHRLDAGACLSGSGKSFVHAEHADPDATVSTAISMRRSTRSPTRTCCCSGASAMAGGCSRTGAEGEQPRAKRIGTMPRQRRARVLWQFNWRLRAQVAEERDNMTSRPSRTKTNLWPALLQFSLAYLALSAIVTAVLICLTSTPIRAFHRPADGGHRRGGTQVRSRPSARRCPREQCGLRCWPPSRRCCLTLLKAAVVIPIFFTPPSCRS